MSYMLDTDMSSYVIKENNPALAREFVKRQGEVISISVITYAELRFGSLHRKSQRLSERINRFIRLVSIIDFDTAAADEYAKIRELLTSKGAPIGDMDMLIAACASSSGAVLVTNNQRHFSQIPGLVIENWLIPTRH